CELPGIDVSVYTADCTSACNRGWAHAPGEHIRVDREPADHYDSWFHRLDPQVLHEVRGWLAGMDAAAYDEVVERLAGHRGTFPQRLMVAFLVPTQREWVEECCREVTDDTG